MPPNDDRSDDEVLERAFGHYRAACTAERALLKDLLEVDRRELWKQSEARCMAHWVCMHLGISYWKADRWIQAAHALESMPAISQALCEADLSLDQVVELTRLASVSPESQGALLGWAQRHSAGAIRARADEEIRWSKEQVRNLQQERSLRWGFYDEGRRFSAALDVPAAEGAVFIKGVSRWMDHLLTPTASCIEARRADVVVAMVSAQVAGDPDPDRASVIVHTRAEGLASGAPGVLEGGGVIDPETLERLSCDARVQRVAEDTQGNAFALGRTTRVPSAAMLRQLRYRDRDCAFPGCGYRRFTNAHHIVHWSRGGRTDLANLVLICTFHHKLVHERGWGIKRESNGVVSWFYPDGYPYWGGPAPPRRARELMGAGP